MAEYVARAGDRIDQIVDTLYQGWTDDLIFSFIRANPRWDGQPIAVGNESFQAPPTLTPWIFADSEDPYYAYVKENYPDGIPSQTS